MSVMSSPVVLITGVYDGRKRTAISEEAEQRFRLKSYTDFGRSRTLISADAEHPGQLKRACPGNARGSNPVTSWKASDGT
jgi:hypothetical protein